MTWESNLNTANARVKFGTLSDHGWFTPGPMTVEVDVAQIRWQLTIHVKDAASRIVRDVVTLEQGGH